MKHTVKRFVFGILSSALLAVGLVRAADRLDPVSQSVSPTEAVLKGGAIPGTSSECDVIQNVL
jgi:hypothetical protein